MLIRLFKWKFVLLITCVWGFTQLNQNRRLAQMIKNGGLVTCCVTLRSNLPLYCFPASICLEAACTCNNNFTLSIGATAVFDIAADIPPARKSFANPTASVGILYLCYRITFTSTHCRFLKEKERKWQLQNAYRWMALSLTKQSS